MKKADREALIDAAMEEVDRLRAEMTAKEMALDAELAETERQLEQAQREIVRLRSENANLRQKLESTRGEAQRTVYVLGIDEIEANERALNGCSKGCQALFSADEYLPGDSLCAVTLTARKVK
jgi:chromosome segregation ATPase